MSCLNLGRLFSALFYHDAQGGMYKQSGITLIRTDYDVFVIHCTTSNGVSSDGVSSDGNKFLGSNQELNLGPFA